MRHLLFACCLVSMLCATGASALVPAKVPQPPALRLGDAVVPVAYTLALDIDPAREDFHGIVDIDVRVAEATDLIWLNARDLKVSAASAIRRSGSRAAQVLEGDFDTIGLRFAEPLPAGPARLHLVYDGRVSSEDFSGLFRRQVNDEWYVLSQMEPLDARRVFPGFDEPQHKVPFSVAITAPSDQKTFFNTPAIATVQVGDGHATTRFATTQPLPTYLVAFGVGPFDIVDAGTAGAAETRIRIIVPRGMQEQAAWAAASTGPILELLEEYFGSPYPYEKLDQITVPGAGFAMEHPGLVTYGQTLMLSRPEDDSIARQRSFALVCAHELAHMWFGDLVTMQWWDDLWLNESFATWMSNKIVDVWQPDWARDVVAIKRRDNALVNDSLASARQIRQPIASNDDIVAAFDGITYGKGASVLAMFEEWIGEDVFRGGVRAYIEANAGGNATAADFLGAIGEAAGADVAAAFSTFLDQNGAPLLSLTLACPQDGDPTLSLAQQRYEPAAAGASGGRQTWQLPVCVRFASQDGPVRQCLMMRSARAQMVLESPSCPSWVLPNAGMLGYYRSDLSWADVDRLIGSGDSDLTVPEQVGIAGDIDAMIAADRLAYGNALARLPDFVKLGNRHILEQAVDLAARAAELVPLEQTEQYAAFIRETFGERARALGWTPSANEDEDTALLRPDLVGLVAGDGRDTQLAARASELADAWLASQDALDPNIVDAALGVAAMKGDEQLRKALLELARERDEEALRKHVFGALADFRDETLVRRNLEVVLDDEFSIFEVWPLWFGPLGEPATSAMVYQWTKDNYERLLERLPRSIEFALPLSVEQLCDMAAVRDAEAFFGPRAGEIERGPITLEQSLESARICAARAQAQRPGIAAFLRERG